MAFYYVQLRFTRSSDREDAFNALYGEEKEGSDLSVAIQRGFLSEADCRRYTAQTAQQAPLKALYKNRGAWSTERHSGLPAIDMVVEAESQEGLEDKLEAQGQERYVTEVSRADLSLKLVTLDNAALSRLLEQLKAICKRETIGFQGGSIEQPVIRYVSTVGITGALQGVLNSYSVVQSTGIEYQDFMMTFS